MIIVYEKFSENFDTVFVFMSHSVEIILTSSYFSLMEIVKLVRVPLYSHKVTIGTVVI